MREACASFVSIPKYWKAPVSPDKKVSLYDYSMAVKLCYTIVYIAFYMTEENVTYNLTFTAGSAMLNEMHAVAEALRDCDGDWKRTKELTFRENLMEKNRLSTNQRVFSLMKQRIDALNEEERTLLVDGNIATRRQIVLLAICKAHPFIFDFIRENVREAFYSLHDRVSYANFNEFFNEKKYIHPELEAITELTIAKMRQVVFRIMEQTELIESTETGILRRPYLTEQMEQVFVKDHPRWLTIFLYSNNEINHLISIHS